MKSRTWSSLVIAAGLLAAPVARAQSAADKASAEALFDEGKRLMDAKRYAEACPKLADSQRLDPGVGTLLNLALCYRENGQTASAWSTYREAAAQARASKQDEREQLARDEANALEPRLTRLVIEVSADVAALPGVEIKRDGAQVPSGLWGIPAPVDPGVRVVEATAPGKKPLRMEATAEGPGATAKVVITALEDAPQVAPPPAGPAAGAMVAPPPQAPTQDQSGSPGSGQRLIGYIVGGLGVVGLGVGGYFTLSMMDKNDKALDICPDFPDGACTEDDVDDHDDLVAEAEAERLNSFMAYGIGAAGVIAGAVLIITAPSGQKTGSVTLTPQAATNGFGLSMSGAF